MSDKDFEKGVAYAYEKRDILFHKYIGWATLIMAPIFYFFSVWDFNTRVNTWAGLTLFGCVVLLLAYSKTKELKKLKVSKGGKC